MNPTASTSTSTSTSTPSSLSSLHPDILLTHILSRLDGPALASVSSASSHLHSLSSSDNDRLWSSISTSTWPSISHPLVSRVISTFPSGHRSFFSDAYPVLHHSPKNKMPPSSSSTSSLISAVDIYYMGKLLVSRVQEIETVSGWFKSSPFRVDLLGEDESVPTPIRGATATEKTSDDLDGWLSHLERNPELDTYRSGHEASGERDEREPGVGSAALADSGGASEVRGDHTRRGSGGDREGGGVRVGRGDVLAGGGKRRGGGREGGEPAGGGHGREGVAGGGEPGGYRGGDVGGEAEEA